MKGFFNWLKETFRVHLEETQATQGLDTDDSLAAQCLKNNMGLDIDP